MRAPAAITVVLLVAACPGGSSNDHDGGDPNAACERVLQKVRVEPAGCAEGKYDAARATCAYFAKDKDGDGERLSTCTAEGLVVTTGDDCDDSNASIRSHTYFIDADDDGFGSSANGAQSQRGCTAPLGFVEDSTDCDDSADGGNASHPGASEVCGTEVTDENCNGMVNEGCGCPFAGDSKTCCTGRGMQTCEAADAGTAWSMCSVAPSAESCNGLDDDCDGQVDEAGATPLCAVAAQSCVAGQCQCPSGQTLCGTVCVSNVGTGCSAGIGFCLRSGQMACSNGAVACNVTAGQPRAEISCNGIDDACNGNGDEETNAPQYWPDCDGDGYGSGAAMRTCTRPSRCGGRLDATQANDCNDSSSNVNPGRSSAAQCNADLDCDGNGVENVTCSPNASSSCLNCPAFGAVFTAGGSRSCSGSCEWNGCTPTGGQVFGPPNDSFFQTSVTGYPTCTNQSTQGGGQGTEYFISYHNSSQDCGWLRSQTISIPPGNYVFRFDNYDTAVLVTPSVMVVVRDESSVAITSGIFSNSNAGWEPKALAFSTGVCHMIRIDFIERSTQYQGGWYRGGNYVGHFSLTRQ